MALIPDGVYVIRNVASNDVVCLQNGTSGGPIVGYMDGPGYPCEQRNLWRIHNIGGGGNQVSIGSACVLGNFASARGQFEGSPLFGTIDRSMIWTTVKVDQGYYLQSPDGNLVWELVAEGAPIVLVHHTGEDNTKWVFERVR